MKIYVMLKKHITKYIFKISIYIFLGILLSIFTTIIPLLTGNFIDALTLKKDLNVIYRFCVVLIFLYSTKFIIEYMASMLYIKVQTKMAFEFNKDVIFHIQKLSQSFLDDKDVAYLNQVVNNDANAVVIFALTTIQGIVINSIYLLIPIAFTMYLNYKMTIFLFCLILIFVFSFAFLKKDIYKKSFQVNEYKSLFFAKLQEQLSNMRFLFINSLEKEMHSRLDGSFEKLFESAITYQKLNFWFSGLNEFIKVASQIIIYIFGGIQIIKGDFTIGMLTIFISYFNRMMSSVSYFYNFGKQYQEICVSYNRLKSIIDKEEEFYGDDFVSQIEEIEIESLKIKFNSDTEIVYKEDIHFIKGNIYAIKGENGKGKSTLINLILGMYKNERIGSILFNKIKIENIDMDYCRKNFFGVSEQNTILLNDSLRYNLIFENKTDKRIDDKIFELSKMIHFDGYINELEQKLEYKVNEKNSNISGGEKQKISILRVLLKNPDVMIFDEPNSFLDSESLNCFLEYLKKIKEKKLL